MVTINAVEPLYKDTPELRTPLNWETMPRPIYIAE